MSKQKDIFNNRYNKIKVNKTTNNKKDELYYHEIVQYDVFGDSPNMLICNLGIFRIDYIERKPKKNNHIKLDNIFCPLIE